MLTRLLVATLCVAGSACSFLDTPAPKSPNAADSAAVSPLLEAAAAIQPALRQFATASGLVIPVAPGVWTNAAVCRSLGTLFLCPLEPASNGMSATTTYQLMDAQNTPQPAFNAATTNTIYIKWDAAFVNATTLISTGADLTAVVHGAQLAFNGSTTSGVLTQPIVPGGPSSGVSTDIAYLTMGPNHYPIAGSLQATYWSAIFPVPPATTAMKIIYDGSATGTIAVSVAGVQTKTCIANLATPTVTPVCTPP